MKANIVIASTLKPVIDPRAYEKIGKSLAKTDKYNVHIIGSYPEKKITFTNISLYPMAKNAKGSFNRILLPWKILRQIQNIKPALLIIGTHELLLIGVLYKFFNSCKLVYDLRENYYRNLIFQKNYPWFMRSILAYYVRSKEYIASSYIDHFLIAESCYEKQLNFLKKKFTIIENKFVTPDNFTKNNHQTKVELLLSGTLSIEYGSLDAIRCFIRLPPKEIKLVIIGQCPNKKTYGLIKELIKGLDNIDFEASSTPVPQEVILSKIGAKTIGLLPYQDNRSTRDKVPTKLYEYIGLAIPILISPNVIWEDILNKHGSGTSFNFEQGNSNELLSKIKKLSTSNYTPDLKPVMWKGEEEKLLPLINRLIFE